MKAPTIPPLIENGTFVQDFSAKAIFNEYFVDQCTTTDTDTSVNFHELPTVPFITKFDIPDEKILTSTRSLNANKAHGWDGISIRVIKLCDDLLILPLKLILRTVCHKVSFLRSRRREMLFQSTRKMIKV